MRHRNSFWFLSVVCIFSMVCTRGVGADEELRDRPLCGTGLLARDGTYEERSRTKVALPSVSSKRSISLGTQMSFRTQDFKHHQDYLTAATCRFAGEHSYVFVEDTQWGLTVKQSDVEMVGALFDSTTAADPNKGIFALCTETFGDPPDEDDDPRIFILLLDIRDRYVDRGDEYYAGYFDKRGEGFRPAQDILYLDTNPLPIASELAKATLAHEFQHMIHWAHDPDEEQWIDEGCSQYAETVCGYPDADPDMIPRFLSTPSISLTDFLGYRYDYGKSYLFILYLAEQYGRPTMRTLVADPLPGIAGVNNAMTKSGFGVRFQEIFSDWTVANYLDREGRYGYRGIDLADLGSIAVRKEPMLPVVESKGHVDRWGTDYAEFYDVGNMRIGFIGEEYAAFSVRLALKEQGNVFVVEFPLSSDNRGTFEISNGDTVALIISGTSARGGGYIYSAERLTTAVPEMYASEILPKSLQLFQSFPNPFNPSTTLSFAIPTQMQGAPVRLEILDLLGRTVRCLIESPIEPGFHTFPWDGRDDGGRAVASGLYIVRLRAGQQVRSEKVIRIR